MKASSNNELSNHEGIFSKFGSYELKDELTLILPNNTITLHDISNGKFLYHRVSQNEVIKKIIQSGSSQIKIELTPVLPIHIPSYKTDFFFLRFTEPLFIGALTSMKGKVSIPIEIGIFLADQIKPTTIDFFNCDYQNARFGLYGLPVDGKLCKYATTSLENNPSILQPLIYAQLEIEITNELEEPVNVSKLVFPVIDHDLYFHGYNVVMDGLKATIKNRIGLQVMETRQNPPKIPKGWSLAQRDTRKKNYDFSMEGGFV